MMRTGLPVLWGSAGRVDRICSNIFSHQAGCSQGWMANLALRPFSPRFLPENTTLSLAITLDWYLLPLTCTYVELKRLYEQIHTDRQILTSVRHFGYYFQCLGRKFQCCHLFVPNRLFLKYLEFFQVLTDIAGVQPCECERLYAVTDCPLHGGRLAVGKRVKHRVPAKRTWFSLVASDTITTSCISENKGKFVIVVKS